MLYPVAAVDAISRAKRVKRQLCPRMPHARQRHGIDHPVQPDRQPATFLQFGIQKTEIKAGIVRNQRRVTQKRDQFFGFLRKEWFVR